MYFFLFSATLYLQARKAAGLQSQQLAMAPQNKPTRYRIDRRP